MSYTESSALGTPPSRRARSLAIRGTFIAVICTSAFLLFLIQPMFSKMAVPLVGGSPGVWTTAMLFFQSILLGGYAYAHWLASSFPVSKQRQIHLVVTALAIMTLPLALPMGWSLPQDGTVTLWLLALFTVSIGAPFFALSANSPLLQEWYAASGEPDGADPYFLYAASNIGSFGALVAYPLLIEPSIGLSDQGMFWSAGYVVLMLGILVAGFMAHDAPAPTLKKTADADAAPLSRKQVAFWMLLSFVPSSVMLSVTAKIATDIGSFPLIWVTTLGLYLLTYVFAFSARFRAVSGGLPRLYGLLAVGMFLFVCFDRNETQRSVEIIVLLGFLFATALCFHTKLAENRPDKRHLTAFFLAMSAGGALGGLFNSILAPMVFNNVHEFTIAVALAFAATPCLRLAWRRDLGIAAAIGAGFIALVALVWSGGTDAILPRANGLMLVSTIIAATTAIILLRMMGNPLRQVAIAGVALAAVSTATSDPSLLMRERSFFGVYEVHEIEDGKIRYLKHGTTIHGLVQMGDGIPRAAAYYAQSGPFGQFFDLLGEGDSVGIVGLGMGGLSCHRAGEVDKVFYEIDPLVDRIARDPHYFGMMDACGITTPTILGDARIEMEKAPDNAHDHIILDAFSSDAIPVHLLTREAFETYDRVLPESGGLFVHISNRHFDLVGPVARVAESLGFSVHVQHYIPDEEAERMERATPVSALIATKDPALAARLAADDRWAEAQGWDKPLWTDDYANTLSALR